MTMFKLWRNYFYCFSLGFSSWQPPRKPAGWATRPRGWEAGGWMLEDHFTHLQSGWEKWPMEPEKPGQYLTFGRMANCSHLCLLHLHWLLQWAWSSCQKGEGKGNTGNSTFKANMLPGFEWQTVISQSGNLLAWLKHTKLSAASSIQQLSFNFLSVTSWSLTQSRGQVDCTSVNERHVPVHLWNMWTLPYCCGPYVSRESNLSPGDKLIPDLAVKSILLYIWLKIMTTIILIMREECEVPLPAYL